jgi:hypothetical protein
MFVTDYVNMHPVVQVTHSGRSYLCLIDRFETNVLEPPMSFGPLSNHQTHGPRLNCYEGPITVSESVKGVERRKMDVEIIQIRNSVGNTCLSMSKLLPDCDVHIPPLLVGHPQNTSRDEVFSEKKESTENM